MRTDPPRPRARLPETRVGSWVHVVGARRPPLKVTLDSDGFERILSELVARIGHRCVVGVGTVTDAVQLKRVAELGARFALSPLNPPGFVAACAAHGVAPVPAAFSPQEVAAAAADGARCIKLFPAQLWTPVAPPRAPTQPATVTSRRLGHHPSRS